MDHPTTDALAIDLLLRRYADIATRQAWDEYGEIVLPDAPVSFTFRGSKAPDIEVTGPDGLAGLGRAAMAAFRFYIYVPLNNLAARASDTTAAGRAYALESGVDHDGNWFDVWGSYDDDYRLSNDGWMIAGRHYREMARRDR